MTEPVAARPCAADVLARTRDLLDPALRRAVGTLPPSMRRVAGYHFGWWDARGRPTGGAGGTGGGGGGKALRPAFTLLAAEGAGGETTAALPAAVAVELVHNFSLIHDDVMDGDRVRRHRPTAWAVFGRAQAILAGDSLLALAFAVLATGTGSGPDGGTDGVPVLAARVQSLLDGQSADLDFEERAEVGLEECVRMAEGKTAALFGCACALGASYGGATPSQSVLLEAFGARVGLAFQIVDDLLGIWGDPAATGKPVHSDLRNRKKSLPVVAALASGTPAGAALAALYRRPLAEPDLARAARLVEEAGGRAWSLARVDGLLDEALESLRAAGLTPEATAGLEALARLAADRDR
ncbi:family 2 encapsulin nanocompartment cargo protein polyprenyl transferase [Microbispora amethystogenes]|uniref:Dimethylallyltransferase n=1 Tax=Microbispora amethystogenes TaxID=1427754 RepID=A0ABQ4FKT4_9ACTN|nr:family 2 encapsulin nanocompartment cargo protein polyprenyl transferase [Microbispora amethystogenes]GIH35422.1 dimethylallyltransferase [Microbispora amethystogenes]